MIMFNLFLAILLKEFDERSLIQEKDEETEEKKVSICVKFMRRIKGQENGGGESDD